MNRDEIIYFFKRDKVSYKELTNIFPVKYLAEGLLPAKLVDPKRFIKYLNTNQFKTNNNLTDSDIEFILRQLE